MLKPILFAAAALAAAVKVSPAFARPVTPGVRTVAYVDLDLSTAAGRHRLERRIDAAVREVCGEAPPGFDLARRDAVRDCIARTRANVRLPRQVATTLAGPRWAAPKSIKRPCPRPPGGASLPGAALCFVEAAPSSAEQGGDEAPPQV